MSSICDKDWVSVTLGAHLPPLLKEATVAVQRACSTIEVVRIPTSSCHAGERPLNSTSYVKKISPTMTSSAFEVT